MTMQIGSKSGNENWKIKRPIYSRAYTLID